jgi:pyruvate formate lyase activating enzyme
MGSKESKARQILLISGGVILFTLLLFLPFYFFRKSPELEQKVLTNLSSDFKEASYYEALENGIVKCELCPNNCLLKPGQRGLCKVRENQGGKLYALNYGKLVAIHIDPIEKKPIFHLLPGSTAYSVAAAGCNMSCLNCQNWEISQSYPEDLSYQSLSPEAVVEAAIQSKSQSIAYTYSEPVIFYEYVYDIAKLAQEKGLKNVMISNGYINPKPLADLLPYLDAIKIDLKGFNEDFYQKVTGGKLQPVLDTIKQIKASGKLLEITYLIIPTLNDSEDEIRSMAKWVKENVGADAILHFSAFHPDYKLKNLPATDSEAVKKARQIALSEGLKYVYTGNIYFPEGETTYCHDGSIAIGRQGFMVTGNNLINGQCQDGTIIPGIWE